MPDQIASRKARSAACSCHSSCRNALIDAAASPSWAKIASLMLVARPSCRNLIADWDACVSVGGCPQVSDSSFGRDTRPVINVNWNEAQQYVAWFSKMTGQRYRLLTEAEWEYAARAGTTTTYYWGDEVGAGRANCNGCGSQWDAEETSPVGSFEPNAFGLYDMAGNVQQWVQDCSQRSYDDGAPADGSAWTNGDCARRAIRGGSWVTAPQLVRSASRNWFAADGRIDFLGFRVARALGP